MKYIVPGFGDTEEERVEHGRFGPESICLCPNEECGSREKHKLKFYVNKGTRKGAFQCFHCGITGKIANSADIQEYEEEIISIDSTVLNEYIQILIDSLVITKELKEYFSTNRNVDMDIIKKYCIGHSIDRPKYPDLDIAVQIGLMNYDNEKYTNKFYRRIIFPIKIQEQWTFVTGRSCTGLKPEAKFINTHNFGKHIPVFNYDLLCGSSKKIYVCEGIPDALAMETAGYDSCIAVLGAGNFPKKIAEKFKGKTAVLIFDNDSAGITGKSKAIEYLIEHDIEITLVDLPEGHDVSDHLFNGGSIVEKQVGKSIVQKELMYIRSGDNLILFGYGVPKDYDIIFAVRDIIERKQVIRATVDVIYRGGFKYRGVVDLSNVRSRASFAIHLYDTNNTIDKKQLKSLLNDLNIGVAQQLEEKQEDKEAKKEYVMSEDEKREAISFLSSGRLLFKVKEALRKQQVVGEDINKILVYLIFTSRIMPQPISAIVKGLSSSGKTHLMKKTMTLFPPEGVFMIQEATAKAFYYLGENDLMHKMIVIGEMHGTEDSEYSIREAQDGIGEGDLIIMTVQKDSDTNEMVTVTKRVKGPCGFITSTTNPEINPENETRNFSIFVQVSPEKVQETAVVLEEQYLGTAAGLSKEEIILFHNAQRCLEKGLRVRIPYVKSILDAFPSSPIRVMRDRVRFLTILETIAIFHQFQSGRKIIDTDEGRFVIANLCDYNIARILLNEILVETLYELPPKAKDIYYRIIEEKNKWKEYEPSVNNTLFGDEYERVESNEQFSITYKDIAEIMHMKKEEIYKWSKPLRDHGYLDYLDHGGGRGKETRLIPIDKDFYAGFLPTANEIAAQFNDMYGEKIYDPITGDEHIIEKPQEEPIPQDILDEIEGSGSDIPEGISHD